MGKYLSIPATKCSGESFCNCFSCSTKNGTGLGEEGSRLGGEDRVGSPCVNQDILGPTCQIQFHPWLQPWDGYMWQAGWLEWATSVLLNHHEGKLGTWPWGSWVLRAESCSMSQLIAFVASHFWRLVMVWTLFGPISCLSIDYTFALCLVLQRLRMCHRASLEGDQHLGMPCLFPFLPLLGVGLPFLFSVIKGIGGCLDHLI